MKIIKNILSLVTAAMVVSAAAAFAEEGSCPKGGYHEWNEGEVVKEPNCVEAGETLYTCQKCGETTLDTKYPDPLGDAGHEWEFVEEKDETLYYKCKFCHDTLQETSDPFHEWDGGVVIKEPTCVDEGVIRYNCIAEDHTPHWKDEILQATGQHAWGEWKYNGDATPDADGTETRTCSSCGTSVTRTALGTKLKPTTPDNPDAPSTPDNPDAPSTPEVYVPVEFPDVPSGKWFTQYVDYVSARDIMKGKTQSDGSITFEPQSNLTRAEFVQILANLSGIDTTSAEAKSQTTRFSDVAANKWFTPAVKWANESGIVDGLTADTFGPDKNIERQQICTMVVRYVEKYMQATLITLTEKTTFTDEDKIQTYAREAVEKCQTAGIINGMTDGRFAPRDNATRAEVAAIIMRFHDTLPVIK